MMLVYVAWEDFGDMLVCAAFVGMVVKRKGV